MSAPRPGNPPGSPGFPEYNPIPPTRPGTAADTARKLAVYLATPIGGCIAIGLFIAGIIAYRQRAQRRADRAAANERDEHYWGIQWIGEHSPSLG
jgi:hypothetical protein